MATIIRDLPYFESPKSVTVRGRAVPVYSSQIVLWVSVSPMGVRAFDPNTPRFPAVLDTGFTHNFLIREDQLNEWAGLRSEHLRELGHIKPYGESIPFRSANVWLLRNKPGQRDEFLQAEP